MMNKVILVGRLARDPDLKTFANGGALANIRVMTNRYWRDPATNTMRERSDGHTVVVHAAAAARRLAEVLKKGDLVHIEGMLENRQWTDAAGQQRWITEVSVRPYNGTVRRLQAANPRAATPDQGKTEQDQPLDGTPLHDAPNLDIESTAGDGIDFFADADTGGADDGFEGF